MTDRTTPPVTRRLALASLGAGGLGLAVAAAVRPAAAQSAMASHPAVGAWMLTTPIGPSLAVFTADGVNIQGVPTAQKGPNGVVTFTGAQIGTWEPIDDHSLHFTSVQLQTDSNGAFVGTVTIDGHPRISSDGQTITDDSADDRITIRDAAGAVVNVVTPYPGAPPAVGVRMSVGAPGLSESTPTAGTPTS